MWVKSLSVTSSGIMFTFCLLHLEVQQIVENGVTHNSEKNTKIWENQKAFFATFWKSPVPSSTYKIIVFVILFSRLLFLNIKNFKNWK